MKEVTSSNPSTLTESHPGFISSDNTTATVTIQPGGSISFGPLNQPSIDDFIQFVLEKHKEEFGFEGESRDRYYFLKGFLNSKKEEMPDSQTTLAPIPMPTYPKFDLTNTLPFLGESVGC